MNGYIEHESDAILTILTRVGLNLRARGIETKVVEPPADEKHGYRRLSVVDGRTLILIQRRTPEGQVSKLAFHVATCPYRFIAADTIADGFDRRELVAVVEDLTNDVLWTEGSRLEPSSTGPVMPSVALDNLRRRLREALGRAQNGATDDVLVELVRDLQVEHVANLGWTAIVTVTAGRNDLARALDLPNDASDKELLEHVVALRKERDGLEERDGLSQQALRESLILRLSLDLGFKDRVDSETLIREVKALPALRAKLHAAFELRQPHGDDTLVLFAARYYAATKRSSGLK